MVSDFIQRMKLIVLIFLVICIYHQNLPADIGAKSRLALDSRMSGAFSAEELLGHSLEEEDPSSPRTGALPAESVLPLRRLTESERNRIYDVAATKFNIKPKSCKEYLVAERLISGSPSEFSRFIHDHAAKLSKRRIGEYIGGVDTFSQDVCSALFALYDFRGETLDAALRKLCRSVRLPGEAQMIDRLLEKFAAQYHVQNKGVFLSSDTAFVLSFSIILLNTDLHNQSIPFEKKMTLEQFVRNNRGIDQGADLERGLLEAIYRDIRDNKINMNDGDLYEVDEVAFMAPTKTGILNKRSSGLLPQWRQRWFVLNDGCLYYFSRPGDTKPRCIIPLDNTRVGRGDVETEFVIVSFSEEVVKSTKFLSNGANVIGTSPRFVLRATSSTERESWLRLLQEEIVKFKPLHELYIKKREQTGTSSEATNSTEALQLILPPPIAQGWMRKRGNINSSWKRRFFVLLPDIDGGGITLFYFVNQQIAQKMLDFGIQTQQGYLRMRHVLDLYTVRDEVDESRISHLEVVTEDRVWSFQPDELVDIAYWFKSLESATRRCSPKVEPI